MKKLITPAMAEELLGKNEHNRKLSPSTVNRIAKLIDSNKFAYNGEPIIIADNGMLLDGQHRLQAVIKSNKEVWMEVIENIPEICEHTGINVFSTIDTGKSRSTSDVISIYDKNVNASLITRTMKAMKAVDVKLLKQGGTGLSRETNESYLDYYIKHSEMIALLAEDSSDREKVCSYPFMKSYDFTVIKYALRNENTEKVDNFIDMITRYDPGMEDDTDECGGDKENLCRIVKNMYKRLSEFIEVVGGGRTMNVLKYISFFKAYHYYKEDIKTGLSITKNMEIMYPDSL